MNIQRLAGLLLAALAVSPAVAQQPATIDGWGKLKFGMSVDEAKKAAPEFEWVDGPGCGKPEPDSRIAYCELSVSFFQQVGVTIAGVEFEPHLTFDQHGQLVEIRLSVTDRYSKAATAQSCQEDADRVAAALAGRFGTMSVMNKEVRATDLAAYQAHLDQSIQQIKIRSQKDPPAKLIEAPPAAQRSFVSAIWYYRPDSGCRQMVRYVSATLPRPIPKDTGKF